MSLPRILMLAASAITLSACAVGPRYHAPSEPPVALAALDPHLVAAAQPPETDWWRTFGDSKLDSLIGRALASNLDVRIAVARVREARALFRDTELNQLPRVTTKASYSRSKQQVPGFSTGRVDIKQADIGFDASWEIDLFGRVRHQVESARADAEAARADLSFAQVTVAAEVARNYLELRGAQTRRAVAEENARTQRDTLRLTEVRYQIGPGDPVDVESARARLNATEAVIPALRTAEAQAGHRLAVLIGQRPGVLDAELAAPATAAAQTAGPTAIPIGDAGDFLRRRPDVQAAERRLAAETARTGVATADLFPRLSVTGFVGFLSGDLSSLFKGGSR
ncbi:MAG TPA: efflux transporter outer membrane subunit, partial [Phenylobacterium sp.]|nr:efflux transporter outer membrane subunit [Phenylobacterium sp.]